MNEFDGSGGRYDVLCFRIHNKYLIRASPPHVSFLSRLSSLKLFNALSPIVDKDITYPEPSNATYPLVRLIYYANIRHLCLVFVVKLHRGCNRGGSITEGKKTNFYPGG